MAEKIRIEKNTAQETLIIPLYGRKLCTELFPTVFSDARAAELCEQLDYDFSELEAKSKSFFYVFGALEGAMRGLDMQWEIRDYLATHPNAAVVNLGCGLDQTGAACDNGTCKLYNVDMPDIIEARESLIKDERATNIASNLSDHSWMDKIDGSQGAIFFAAGVFHYLTRNEMKALVSTMAKRFSGARLVFDAVGKLGQRAMMKVVLKNFDMHVDGELFWAKGPQDVEALSDGIRVTNRGFMLGYNNMNDPAISPLFRLLARIADSGMKMQIYRVEFVGNK